MTSLHSRIPKHQIRHLRVDSGCRLSLLPTSGVSVGMYWLTCCLLFMYTASVMFDYYYRDSKLSCIRGIGFQSTPSLEGAGVFNVPEGYSPQNTEPPFKACFELLVSQTRSLASIMLDFTYGVLRLELRN